MTIFTVREFTDRLPMIAGRIKIVSDTLNTDYEDPISQVDFVVFYPGRALVAGRNATPSLGLFSAKHASGKVEKTRVLEGYESHSRAGSSWVKEADRALMYFPMASVTSRRQPDGVELTLAFLGMGHLNDYYLELECGKVDKGHLMVEGESGRLADYEVEFTEMDDDGQEVRNIMIAGFNPDEREDYTWLRIGKEPVDTQINFTQTRSSDAEGGNAWMSYRIASTLKPVFEQKDLEYRMVNWVPPNQPRLATTPSTVPVAEYRDAGPAGNADAQAARPPGTEEAEVDHGLSWTNLILSRAIETWQAHF
jgi:hypothetical protein